MSKTIEQIMEEQMAQMMAMMMNQSNQSNIETNTGGTCDNPEDSWEDWDSDKDSEDSWEDFENLKDNSSNGDDNSNVNKSTFSTGESDANEINVNPLTSNSYTSQFNDEDQLIVRANRSIAKKFAYDNYNSIGAYLLDSNKFYSITDIDSFSDGFESFSNGKEDELMPLLIRYANTVINGSLSSSNTDDLSSSNTQNRVIESINNQIMSLTRKLEEIKGRICNEKEFFCSQDMQLARNEARDKVMNNNQPFEFLVSEPRHASFMGNTFEYQQYAQERDFRLDFKIDSPEDFCLSLRKVTECIANDIANIVGGFNRITDLMILSNTIIVNGVSYEPILPLDFINSLPLDVQNSAKAGQYALLFDFAYLRKMTNLTNLYFDSADFLFKKVRVDLNLKRDFEPKNLFNICKRLLNLQVNTYCFTRNNMNEHDDIFHRVRRSTEIADWCQNTLDKGRKFGCDSVIDFWNSRESRGFLGNAWGLAWRGTATAGVGLAEGGLVLGRAGTKLATSLKNGISAVIQATKEEL